VDPSHSSVTCVTGCLTETRGTACSSHTGGCTSGLGVVQPLLLVLLPASSRWVEGVLMTRRYWMKLCDFTATHFDGDVCDCLSKLQPAAVASVRAPYVLSTTAGWWKLFH
jgi:hypothetical protein